MRLFNKTKINFLSKRKYATIVSIIFIVSGIFSLITKAGPKLSIDFTGGTIVQMKFDTTIEVQNFRNQLQKNNITNFEVIEFGSKYEYLLRLQTSKSSDDLIQDLKTIFNENNFEVRRVETVGPRIGRELRSEAIYAIVMALIGILFYIWFRFDRYYALGSVAALIHDVIFTLGIFSMLNLEINLTIIAAFLTIVGYSLNDTIVVFDRIRENISKYSREDLESVVNLSLNETLNRTIITSFTTLMVVITLFIIGGEVIKLFSFALIIGVIIGTYSSLYVASPVMIYFEIKAAQKLSKK